MSYPLNTLQVLALDEHNTGLQWLKSMASGGLRRSASADAEAAYALADHIHQLEEAIQETYTLEQFFFPLPKWWWIWVPGLYGLGFLWALQKEHFAHRLTTWGYSLMLFGVFAGWFLATKFYRERRALADKKRRRPLLQEERRVAMVDLLAARDACVAAAKKTGFGSS